MQIICAGEMKALISVGGVGGATGFPAAKCSSGRKCILVFNLNKNFLISGISWYDCMLASLASFAPVQYKLSEKESAVYPSPVKIKHVNTHSACESM